MFAGIRKIRLLCRRMLLRGYYSPILCCFVRRSHGLHHIETSNHDSLLENLVHCRFDSSGPIRLVFEWWRQLAWSCQSKLKCRNTFIRYEITDWTILYWFLCWAAPASWEIDAIARRNSEERGESAAHTEARCRVSLNSSLVCMLLVACGHRARFQ